MNEKREQGRNVTSIARKINWRNVCRQFCTYLKMDCSVCLVLAAVFIYGMDIEKVGKFYIFAHRSILTDAKLKDTIYQVILSENDIFYQVAIGQWLVWLRIGAGIILIFQVINILKLWLYGTSQVRKSLKPLNEIAIKAQELSDLAMKESAFDETKYHNLESAISNFEVGGPETKIQMNDKDLQGIESALNDLLERMRKSYKQQAQFVSDASHELRTPIAVIQGYVNMLDRWGKEDEAILDESIEAIKNEASHMQKLVEQLLFLARGDSNRQKLDMKNLDLNKIMREVYDESLMIDEKHIYKYDESGKAFVYGDADMLKQSARILVDNAAKYTPEGEEILIKVGVISENQENGAAYSFYSIQDNGIGMSPSDVEHAFDRFYRADIVRNSKNGGTGLGLSIAKWIVEKHHGYYNIISREGIGSRFQVIFPTDV